MLIDVRDAHRFPLDPLLAYVGDTLGIPTHTVRLQQFDAGQSNPTFLLTIDNTPYVLRKKPPGDLLPKAHMVEREYRVMKALETSDVPVPRMLLLCEDSDVIGTPFFLMEYVQGRVFWDARFPDQPPSERTALFRSMSDTLAALHSVDYASVGLDTFGRAGNYFARQLSIWTRQYQASETQNLPAMNHLMEWLPNHVPEDDTVSLVHGDFRLDNLIFHPTQPKVIAVLDWELSTIGHPLADLAYNCMGYLLDSPYHPALNPLCGGDSGIPTLEERKAWYCQATGRADIPSWNFYVAFSIFRSCAIIQGVYKRGLQGNASSSRALELGHLVASGAQAARELTQ